MMTSTNAGTPNSQASTYLPTILLLSSCLRSSRRDPWHEPNGPRARRGARRYRAVRIAPAMSKLQLPVGALQPNPCSGGTSETAFSIRLARAMRKAKRVQAQETVLNRNGVEIMMRKLLSAVVLGTFVVGLFSMAGCNTMSGAGKDVQRGGQKLEDSAERNKAK